MRPNKTIILVDDHTLFREGLKTLISNCEGYEVVAEASSAAEALEKLPEFFPDLLMLDVTLPGAMAIESTRQIRKKFNQARIIAVGDNLKVRHIVEVFDAGAKGFIAKDAPPGDFLEAIQTVLDGGYYMADCVSHKVIEQIIERKPLRARAGGRKNGELTPREMEIFELIAKGNSHSQIAEKFFISPKTVRNHRANIMAKLDLHSTHDIIRTAIKMGVLDVDEWIDEGKNAG